MSGSELLLTPRTPERDTASGDSVVSSVAYYVLSGWAEEVTLEVDCV